MAKIRAGFVSNSSSSSFLIYGIYVTSAIQEKIKEVVGGTDTKSRMLIDQYLKKDGKSILDHIYSPDGDYIGASWDSIPDDQTPAQWRAEIKQALADIATEADLLTHEDAWYDG